MGATHPLAFSARAGIVLCISVSPDLDPAALARLERLGGPPFVARILDLFLRDAPPKVAAMRAALDARDADAVAYWAHALVSSSGNLGATRMQALVRRIEQDALAGRWEPLPALVSELETVFTTARTGLAAELERRQV
jgi:HPt (histidine-containing phosphotransfer) domain-containing protein